MWLWIGIGLGAFVGVSVLVGGALAAMLGSISRGVTDMHDELFEAEAWAVQPLTTSHRRPRRRRRPLELELHP